MRHRIRLVTVGAALIIMAATLIWASGAAASSYKILHYFTWAKNPQGNLIFDAAGNLYGTTYNGPGSGCLGSGCGTIWKLKPNANGTWTVSILHVFKGADGSNPSGGLVSDAAGNLYGTTSVGGGDESGVVFKLAPNPDGTWTYSVLHSFTDDENYPNAPLIFDAAGNLYGTTGGAGEDCARFGYYCGTVFKLKPNPDGTWTESVLHSFSWDENGYNPDGLIFDAAGNLYGTTWDGGSFSGEVCSGFGGCGVVFKLAPNPDGTWTETVLYSFSGGADGGNPGGLIFDAAGNLYGGTVIGGSGGSCGPGTCGVVFRLKPNPDGTWTESVLHSFTGGADGGYPDAGLALNAGNLYGTTYFGGAGGYGTVFKLVPNPDGTWTERVLHSFWGVGAGPAAPVIFDPAGNLYGTTSSGTNNYGLVFEITP